MKTTNHEPVWVQCQETGCTSGIGVHWRHVDNFEGRYWCPEHNSGALDEVTC